MIARSHQEGGLRPTLRAYLNSCHEMGPFHETGDDYHQPHGFCVTFATRPCCYELKRLNLTGLKKLALIIVVALQVKKNHDKALSRSNW